MLVLMPALFGINCGDDDPAMGTLIIRFLPIKAPPNVDVTAINISPKRVDVVYQPSLDSAEQILTILEPTPPVTLPIGNGESPVQQVMLPVSPGFIPQVRFVVNGVTATVAGQETSVKLPSGPETGWKIIPCNDALPFPVVANGITYVDVGVDLKHQLVQNNGSDNLWKPVSCGRVVEEETVQPQFIADQVFVMFAAGTAQTTVDAIAQDIGVTPIRKAAMHPWYTFQLPTGSNEGDFVDAFAARTQVVTAMRNYNAHTLNKLPADFSGGEGETTEHWLFTTQSPQAWDATVGDRRVILAVHDSSVNIFHEELQENIFINIDEIPVTVTTNRFCAPLDPMQYVDLSGLDLDINSDGATTLADFNIEPNRTLILNALAQTGRTPSSGTGDVRLEDFLDPFTEQCGLFENSKDDPLVGGNGLPDDLFGWDFIEGDNYPGASSACSILSHGGAVAGIAAATEDGESIFTDDGRRAPNYVGQAWKMRILPIRGTDPESETGRDVRVESLAYAIDMGAHIVNVSWSEICLPPKDPHPDLLRCTDAERAEKLATMSAAFSEANVESAVLVVGGINREVNLDELLVQDLPAELKLATQINVNSVDKNGAFPNDGQCSYGPATYDIAAPGRTMVVLASQGVRLATDPDGPLVACDGFWHEGGEIKITGGNSFAAPQVAGVAALVIAKELDESGGVPPAPIFVRARILDNADLVANPIRVASGRRLNACRAVMNGPCP